jgi:hypothetical protein
MARAAVVEPIGIVVAPLLRLAVLFEATLVTVIVAH